MFEGENRSDMVVYVKLRDTQELIKGRYKFPLDTTEKQVLKTILLQFTEEELRRVSEITLDPVVQLFWLRTKKVYLFN